MKRITGAFLAVALLLALLGPASTAYAAGSGGTYLVSVERSANGEEVSNLGALAVGTEVTVRVTMTRTDIEEDTYNCRGLELDINDFGLEYIEGSAQTFGYTVNGTARNATVGDYLIGGASGVGNLRFFYIFGALSTNASKTFVDQTVTVSARYRVVDPSVARAWAPTPIVYIGDVKETDIRVSEFDVTFDPNGGTMTDDPTGIYKLGAVITTPTPARPGYRFLGWSDGSQTFADKWTVDGSKRFVAQWELIVNTLRGVVQEEDGTPIAGVAVRLVWGSEEFGSTVTDELGRFAIVVADGEYDLVAYDSVKDRTKTELVTMRESAPEMTVVMPGGDKNSVLDNTNAGEFAARVGGLDGLADKEVPGAGEHIEIRLTVTADNKADTLEPKVKTDYESGKQVIGALDQAKNQKLTFFNLKLERTAVGGSNPGKTTLGTSDSLLRIILPYDTSGKKNLRVYRSSGGTAAELLAAPNEQGEHIIINDDTIEIYARTFYAYAIGYDPEPGSNPGSGGSGGSGGGGGGGGGTPTTPTTPEKPSPSSPTETGVADWLITGEHILYIRGYDDGRIAPNSNITRAEVAMIFYRLLKDQNVAVTLGFPDVLDKDW